ncbi:MAG: D-2-hydroxyacid dehydrogenase [Saprospiraceae bacterium]|nr:D-2-hydroxyacid dehydrogenase [Saprospiraceae bacterium]
MAKILINDGLHPSGIKMLEEAGHTVSTEKIAQDDLLAQLKDFDGICVRSATKVRKELIDLCPNLKFIGRGGVGLDNIDVDYARSKGIQVLNTPAASSRSVAELAFAHMLSLSRFVYQSNRQMPNQGNTEFGKLKKSYSKGSELEGKTLGVIGLGRIGQEAAKIGMGLGMKVVGVDPFIENSVTVKWTIANTPIEADVPSVSLEEMLAQADFITMHIPFTGSPALGQQEFAQMKKGVILVDAARGGTIDEDALLEAVENGTVSAAGLDVFVNEPNPREDILAHPRISLTPHIGASTLEAQEKIGTELAGKILEVLS